MPVRFLLEGTDVLLGGRQLGGSSRAFHIVA